MAGDTILSSVSAVIEIQDAGTGHGNRQILDVATGIKPALGGFNKNFGAIQRNYMISPRTNRPVPRPVKREMPEAIAPEMKCKMAAANYMERFDEDARFTLYVRHPERHVADLLDYKRIDILQDVALESFNFGDFVADEPTTDDVTLTVPLNAAAHMLIKPLAGVKLQTGLNDAKDCAIAAAAIDEDGVVYAVTEADAVGNKPFLVVVKKDGASFSEIELTDLSADCAAITVAGSNLLIASGTGIHTYTKAGVKVSSYTAAGAINALLAVDAANIIACGAAGLLITSSDSGTTWTTLTTGLATALNSISARHIGEWFVGGASGALLKYQSGQLTALTLPAALNTATVNDIALPDAPAGFDRSDDIYIACSNGSVWRSGENGAVDTWEQVAYPGNGAGAATKIAFVGFLGQVLYILHTNAGGDSVLLRDFCGGVGSNANVEQITVPANSGFNALLALGPNDAWLLGNVHSAADLVVKVEEK
ncbi:MAG TPA: hypothetical protein PKD09_09200 [Aggregatilinea sp.]|uniref:hypothetical protein n=1 Tax=Aggregatilinea sp. TaxID=2806333 RepID=UPI002C9F7DAF|nr:hypothetical protein [Aggregatilinea sp.]HML21812.1 hypothetical protein [Aggregatilinea sp.]